MSWYTSEQAFACKSATTPGAPSDRAGVSSDGNSVVPLANVGRGHPTRSVFAPLAGLRVASGHRLA